MTVQEPKLTGPATPHPQYDEWSDRWQTCSDVIAGARQVKGARERYLIRLEGDSDQDYEDYIANATWVGASGRSVDALVGAIMRKPMEVKAPKLVTDDLETGVTITGEKLPQFASKVIRELLTTGRGVILVDIDEASQQPMWRFYGSRSVLNWRQDRAGSIQMLTFMETAVVPVKDARTGKDKKWQKEVQKRPKRIELNPSGAGVKIQIWRQMTAEERRAAVTAQKDDDDGWVVDDEKDWLRKDKPLTEIPAVAVTAEGLDLTPVALPLEDLCELNLDHYRVSAKLGQAVHYTAMPIYYAVGVEKQSGEIRLRPRIMITLEPPQLGAQVNIGILEYKGAGIAPLMDRLNQMERQMTTLGARPLTQQSMASTNPEAIRLRASGEQALLTRLVAAVEAALELALRQHAMWRGVSGDGIEVKLNRDFMPARMQPGEIKVLLEMVMAGQITQEAFLAALVAGEVLSKAQAKAPPKPPPQPVKPGQEGKGDGTGSDRGGTQGVAGGPANGNEA